MKTVAPAMPPGPQEEDEASLSTVEAHLERVVSTAPLILWSIDRSGIFRFVRGSGLAALNVSPEDLLGRSVYDTFPDLSSGCAGACGAAS